MDDSTKDRLIEKLLTEVERLKAAGGGPSSAPNPSDVGADEWTILYHGGGTSFKGRAEFLRLMLEDAGVPYNNSSKDLNGPTGKCDGFRGDQEKVRADGDDYPYPFPIFYPPAIWHKPKDGPEVHINQVHACIVYLAEQLGYAPASAAERALADSIALNAQDYISAGRATFHPIKNTMSYNDQKEEGDKASKEFAEGRMGVWLQHLEKVVKQNSTPTAPVAGGPKLTYADFALYHVLDATKTQFNTEYYGMAWDNADVPGLKAFHAWMEARPNIAAYHASDRLVPFSGNSMM
jgi:glutathione S-transferase